MDEYEYLTIWLKSEVSIEVGECKTFISPERVLIVVETGKETRVFNADCWSSVMGKPLIRL